VQKLPLPKESDPIASPERLTVHDKDGEPNTPYGDAKSK
jgi:hypothetical protein